MCPRCYWEFGIFWILGGSGCTNYSFMTFLQLNNHLPSQRDSYQLFPIMFWLTKIPKFYKPNKKTDVLDFSASLLQCCQSSCPWRGQSDFEKGCEGRVQCYWIFQLWIVLYTTVDSPHRLETPLPLWQLRDTSKNWQITNPTMLIW